MKTVADIGNVSAWHEQSKIKRNEINQSITKYEILLF